MNDDFLYQIPKRGILPLLLVSQFVAYAQMTTDVLQVDDIYDNETLIEDIFLRGYCKNTQNVISVGTDYSVGHFFNGEEIIGIDEGILISTGDISLAEGPNESERASRSVGTVNDVDIQRIATSGVYDASGLIFEFVPIGNRVSFTYVFASEEYCEFVNSDFNDVFGFFVSGPGINGPFSNNGINVARIPGSQEFVSINSINHLLNSDLYIPNERRLDADACLIEYNPRFLDNIEYDGFTLPLRAEFDVIPCETYQIRLIAADVQDQILDTGVFLEMNSFDIGGNVRVIASSETSNVPIASESCSNGVFIFERLRSESMREETFYFTIDPNSTAVEGEDFLPLQRSVTFPPGESRVELVVEILSDDLVENPESLGLLLDLPCDCFDSEEAVLTINDDQFFEASFDSISACIDQEFALYPIITGGSPPFTMNWDNDPSLDTLFTSISTSSVFNVSVRDICGRDAATTITVGVREQPVLTLSEEYQICSGMTIAVDIPLEGIAPWSLTYQKDEEEEIVVDGIMFSPYALEITSPGSYRITNLSDLTCSASINGVIEVVSNDIEVNIDIEPPTCSNTRNGSIYLSVMSPNDIEEIIWSPPVNDDLNPSELLSGLYGVKIIDTGGCTYENVINLDPKLDVNDIECSSLNIYIPNVFTPNGDGQNDQFLVSFSEEPSIRLVKDFSIYDRWGNAVFRRKDFSKEESHIGFDGSMNNDRLSTMVLTYIARFELENGDIRTVSGDITLLR